MQNRFLKRLAIRFNCKRQQLQPWQRSFVTMFLQHRETYGKARMLLADQIGLGKTLSLGASAMLAALLDDGPDWFYALHGQVRRSVDMLVYHQTQDEEIYQVLSKRLKDKYDIFGGLPDTIEDDWIDNIEKLQAMMDQYMHL
jgi:hypothetical protein